MARLPKRNLMITCVLLAACSLSACSSSASSAHADATGSTPEPIGYPRGPWWRGNVNQTLLGVAHILISHREARMSAALLKVPGTPNARSHDEARALALQLRSTLRRDPARFDELAKQYSDDPATASLGGVIGAMFAPHLPIELVDALGNLRPGEVSRVVETELGFQIVRRIQLDPPLVMDGSSIVVGYDKSETVLRADRPITRTRAAAFELAKQLRAQLSDAPSAFERLAREYSDSFEAVSGGDYGQWSSVARGAEPTVLYVLSRLEPTQISEVLDTPAGFRIVRRDAHKERGHYATTAFVVGYDHVGSLIMLRNVQTATAMATEISKKLRKDPKSFEALRAANCDYKYCTTPAQGIDGGAAAFVPLVAELAKLRIGEITIQPVPTALGWMFARREDAARYPVPEPPMPAFDLPKLPPLSLQTATKEELAWYMNELRSRVAPTLKLDAQHQQQLDQIFDNLTLSYQTVDPNARGQVTADAGFEVLALLGRDDAAKLGQVNEALLRHLSGETIARN